MCGEKGRGFKTAHLRLQLPKTDTSYTIAVIEHTAHVHEGDNSTMKCLNFCIKKYLAKLGRQGPATPIHSTYLKHILPSISTVSSNPPRNYYKRLLNFPKRSSTGLLRRSKVTFRYPGKPHDKLQQSTSHVSVGLLSLAR